MSALVRAPLIAALCFVGLGGCGPDEANEARLFLDRYETLQEDGLEPQELAPRGGDVRARVEALGRLSFESERVKAAQQRCVAMHEAALRADESREEATRLVSELERATPESRRAMPREPIEAALAASTRAVEEARQLRPGCDEAVSVLRSRYGAARAR